MSLEGTLVLVLNEIVMRLRLLQIWNFLAPFGMSLSYACWECNQEFGGAKAKLKVLGELGKTLL